MSDSMFLTRVVLENYKSIQHCDVQMRPLMFLVGPNGAGKSNFLDSLRFVSDALNTSLDHAVRQRIGIGNIMHFAQEGVLYFAVRLEFCLPTGETGCYAFRIGANGHNRATVLMEECRICSPDGRQEETYFRVDKGQVTTSEIVVPKATLDRLYLVALSSLPAFRSLYDALSRMAFYNLNPEKIRDFQTPGEDTLLSHDGDNIAGVLQKMMERAPDMVQRIREYLRVIVPSIWRVDVQHYGPKETLTFMQQFPDALTLIPFPAASMSDGTLRALGVLVALFQTGDESSVPVSLVGIEEPETALHPAAVAVLLDALEEANMTRQVLVTSHSADLLDNKRIDPDALFAVVSINGRTEIGPIDAASRSMLRDHLFTAGEMLRLSQFTLDTSAALPETVQQTPPSDEQAA